MDIIIINTVLDQRKAKIECGRMKKLILNDLFLEKLMRATKKTPEKSMKKHTDESIYFISSEINFS